MSQVADFGKEGKRSAKDEGEDGIDWEAKLAEEEKQSFSAWRAMAMATEDKAYLLLGAVGAASEF
jgi:hypothetical protein